MTRTIIAFAFLLLPLLEIAGFVVVGSQIGVLATIGLVIASAILGAALLRRAGLDAMRQMQRDLEDSGAPQGRVVDSAMMVVAGFLLMIPGFLTDIVALLLLVPAVRRALFGLLRDRVVVVRGGQRGPTARRPDQTRTIDLDAGEYRHVEPGSSPWRRDPDKDE